ncbi:MAG: response regulator transcription factor [Gemmatimonadales bacterium]
MKDERKTKKQVLLDLSMPGPGFLQLLHQLRDTRCRGRVVVLSIHSEQQYAVRALRAGAAAYLSKDQPPEALAEAIRRVYRGGRYVTPTLAGDWRSS